MNVEQPTADSAPRDRSAAPSSFSFWPGLIFVLLGGQIILMLVMAYLATSDRSFAVEPDYYQKALRWDEAVAEQRASARLGWNVQLSVAAEADLYKNRNIDCTVTDRSGRPLENASVELVAFAHARGSQWTELQLEPIATGHFAGRLRVPRAGRWEFRIVVRRDEQTHTEIQQMVVDPARGESS